MNFRLIPRLLFTLVVLLPASPVDATPDEYEVKAAFLLNFAQLVDWPSGSEPADALVIGVVGDSGALQTLRKSLTGAEVEGVSVDVRGIEDLASGTLPHMVFVTRDADAAGVVASAGRRAVLTVGETRGFAREGGMINFVRQGKKLRFEINHAAAQAAGLRISSRLLRLAVLVQGE